MNSSKALSPVVSGWEVNGIYTAESSRCFQSSGGKLSCLTCNDPHGPMPRADAGFYRSRCVTCHARAHKQDADCTGCHMPAVRASSHLTFRNHQIGIYR